MTADNLLSLAAAAEAPSEHPLAQAVVEAAFNARLTPPEAETFEAIPGKGITVRIGGAGVVVGSPRFMAETGVDLARLGQRIGALEEKGRTVIAVARNGELLGQIGRAHV